MYTIGSVQVKAIYNIIASAVLLVISLAPAPAFAQFWQCVTFARQASGIEIHGNAKTWWAQAAGRYERGQAPRVGAVMAMPGSGRMRLGHVAMVSRIVSDREVLLTHANWSSRGRIERNVRAVDVSPAGDWSRVKIWFASNGDLGTSSYPVSGFIYAGKARAKDQFALSGDVAQLAMAGQ
jgi:surface antigen